jgi:hypothetical protein
MRRGFALVALVAIIAQFGSAATAEGARLPKRFFGIVPQTALTPVDTARMAAGGIGSLRTPVDWSVVEREPGKYDWYGLDGAVRLAARERIEVLPYFYGTPSWLAGRATKLPVGNGRQRRAWRDFLRAAVERYSPGGEFWTEDRGPYAESVPPVPIRTWQVWNEENSFYFARPASPRLYGRLLKDSARTIRSVDRRAEILIGGLFGRPKGRPPRAMAAADFLDRLYRIRGMKRFFDGVALHPYAANITALRRKVWTVRRVMQKHRDGRTGLYLTELGWGSQNNARKVAFEVGRRGQARELRTSYRYLISKRRVLNLKSIYWFTWKDATDEDGPICNFCDSAGLFGAGDGLKPKPAWRAFVQLVRASTRPAAKRR